MAFVCILKENLQQFREDIKARKLNIMELLKPDMTSEMRTEIFTKYSGDVNTAKAMNTLFEEKIILKNKIAGLKNFVSKVGELGRYDPLKKEKLANATSEFKKRQQERIFSPTENETFLNELADIAMGTHIAKDEALNLFKLQKESDTLKEKYDPATEKWASEEDRIAYRTSLIALDKYNEFLKDETLNFKELVKSKYQEYKQMFKEDAFKASYTLIKESLETITDTSIALVATLDDSFLGRQGIKTLYTHPTVWAKMAANSFVDFAKTIGGKNVMDILNADVKTRPNYLNGNYQKAGIIPKTEEQFPIALPERMWGIGRIIKASEAAFKGSALYARTRLYDLISEQQKENGLDMNDKTNVKDLGRLVNSMTARGSFGNRDNLGILKVVFWAPKMLKANWDFITAHSAGTGLETSFARKEAAKNLVKFIVTVATVLLIATAIDDDATDFDPRSSKFGKIWGIDITGGAASLVTLASRLAPGFMGGGKYKSGSTGKITPYGSGFGQTSRFDAVLQFLENKTTPAAGAVIDLLKGEDFAGNEPTIGSTLFGSLVPISAQNIINLKDDASADKVAGAILDVLGFSKSSFDYTPRTKEWKKLQEVKSSAIYNKAFIEFNEKLRKELGILEETSSYKKANDEERAKMIDKKREAIQKEIVRKYIK